jgi:hypothetical protein
MCLSRRFPSRSSFQKSLALQPVHLGTGVSPDYIGLIILDFPGNDNNHITLSDPDPLLHLARNAAHPGNTIDASHFNAIGPKQAFHMTEYFSILFAGETNSGNYSSFFFPATTSIIQLITSNNNYGPKTHGIFGVAIAPSSQSIYLFALTR